MLFKFLKSFKTIIFSFGCLVFVHGPVLKTATAEPSCLKIAFSDRSALTNAQIKVFKRVYQYAGLCLNPQIVPNKRSDALLRNGIIDGDAFGRKSRIDQYRKLVLVQEPLLTDVSIVVSKRPDAYNSMEDLVGSKVGIKRGSYWEDTLRQTGGIDLTLVSDRKVLFPMLKADRVDAIVVRQLHIGLNRQNHLNKSIAFELGRVSFFHSLLSKHRNLVPRLENAIKTLKANGEIPSTAEEWAQLALEENSESSSGHRINIALTNYSPETLIKKHIR